MADIAPASSDFIVNPFQSPMGRQTSPSFTCYSHIGRPCFPLSTFDCFAVLLSPVLRSGELLPSTQMLIPVSVIAVGALSPFTYIFGFIWIPCLLFFYKCNPWVFGFANLVALF